MDLGDKRLVVVDRSVGGGVLQQYPKPGGVNASGAVVANHDFDVQGQGAGFDHIQGLRVTGGRHPEGFGVLFLAGIKGQGHGFGGGGAFVKQRGIGDFHPG